MRSEDGKACDGESGSDSNDDTHSDADSNGVDSYVGSAQCPQSGSGSGGPTPPDSQTDIPGILKKDQASEGENCIAVVSSAPVSPVRPAGLGARRLHRSNSVASVASSADFASFNSQKSQGAWINSFLANVLFGGTIVVNAAFLGVEADYRKETPPDHEQHWLICETIFLAIFSIELLLRFQAERCRCLRDCWNIFDLILVSMGILDTVVMLLLKDSKSGGTMQMLTLFRVLRLGRLARVLRIVKLFRFLKELMILGRGIYGALKGFCWVLLFIVMVLYTCAVLITNTIGHNAEAGTDVDVWFGTMGKSLLTLFALMTLENWPDIVRGTMEQWKWSWLFFIPFIMFTSFVLLNLITAIVVERIIASEREAAASEAIREENQRKATMKRIQVFFQMMDSDGNGELDINEFATAIELPHIMAEFQSLGFTRKDAMELFHIFDVDGDATLSMEEFIDGALRWQGPAKAKHLLQLQFDQVRMKNEVTKNIDSIGTRMDSMGARMDSMSTRMDSIEVLIQDLPKRILNMHIAGDEGKSLPRQGSKDSQMQPTRNSNRKLQRCASLKIPTKMSDASDVPMIMKRVSSMIARDEKVLPSQNPKNERKPSIQSCPDFDDTDTMSSFQSCAQTYEIGKSGTPSTPATPATPWAWKASDGSLKSLGKFGCSSVPNATPMKEKKPRPESAHIVSQSGGHQSKNPSAESKLKQNLPDELPNGEPASEEVNASLEDKKAPSLTNMCNAFTCDPNAQRPCEAEASGTFLFNAEVAAHVPQNVAAREESQKLADESDDNVDQFIPGLLPSSLDRGLANGKPDHVESVSCESQKGSTQVDKSTRSALAEHDLIE
eukprot:gnl/MRDRNA2_/MRDRNA2_69975_c0_seq1.p1 gnl/MRDRNA2_/MRDRNA2_69975_c0~~gnl/MRDRNA2_/MRDRNA2_69975_c0_seq1.p1  ORF type:complete len:838 (+),score=120.08 gnl/MRDRNA2_/MRDRNA2_69975_c0_seq1:173-2686(+)